MVQGTPCTSAEARRSKSTLGLSYFLLKHEIMPESWGRAVIVNLYKDGERTDPGNYRGIALISCLGKLYLSLWAKRLCKFAESKLREGQGGFRLGRSTVGQCITLLETLLRRKREGKPTYLYFVDFRKAFDTVWHAGLWKRLWDTGVQGKAWRIIRSLYSSIHASVRVGDKSSRFVRMKQGVRQGCPISPVLFNCFIDELSRMLDDASPPGEPYGIEAADRTLHSLLYADDVVLMAETPEKLQTLIDVVDEFCKKWHMEINLKKSQAMVVGTHGCTFCSPMSRRIGCCNRECCPWSCRGAPVKVVKLYKYLGIWFNSKLNWTDHIDYMVTKAKKRTASLGGLMNNNRVPARAKFLVWLAFVRPLLEYGGEVWKANSKQETRIESIQIQAGVKALKLNSKCNVHAVRALMHVPTLKNRRQRARLKYLVKTKTMDPSRHVRHVVELPEGKAICGQGANHHWMHRIMAIMKDEPDLERAYKRMKQSLQRNGNVLPTGLDPTLPSLDNSGDLWYSPTESWNKALDWWLKQTTLDETLTAGNARTSTLRTIIRACKDQDAVPRFPLTKHPNCGPDQIRVRLLCGTSALNSTMSRVQRGKRSPRCPGGETCTAAGHEDSAHFLLTCHTHTDLRKAYEDGLKEACTCTQEDGQENFTTCHQYFTSLNQAGKVLFMLGGPVKGRVPEAPVDALAREYVLHAYTNRSEILNSNAEDPLHIDLTKKVGGIRSFFLPVACSSSSRAHALSHTYMPRPVASRRREGSGLNDQYVMGKD